VIRKERLSLSLAQLQFFSTFHRNGTTISTNYTASVTAAGPYQTDEAFGSYHWNRSTVFRYMQHPLSGLPYSSVLHVSKRLDYLILRNPVNSLSVVYIAAHQQAETNKSIILTSIGDHTFKRLQKLLMISLYRIWLLLGFFGN